MCPDSASIPAASAVGNELLNLDEENDSVRKLPSLCQSGVIMSASVDNVFTSSARGTNMISGMQKGVLHDATQICPRRASPTTCIGIKSALSESGKYNANAAAMALLTPWTCVLEGSESPFKNAMAERMPE